MLRPAAHRALLLLVIMAVAAAFGPRQAYSSDPDDAPRAAFFDQTGRGDGSGYNLRDGVDASGAAVRFFSEFRRLGGVEFLGYPISRPFLGAGGFTYQAFQRGVLQWRPDVNRAALANTFEWLYQAERDSWLDGLGVPAAIPDDGSQGDWTKARATRLGWLTDPAIRQNYLANPGSEPWTPDDAIQRYGLPMSLPERRGPFVVQRFQRVALQLWLESVPKMPTPGSVVGILGGDLLKQSGLIPAEAQAPELSNATNLGTIRAVYLSSSASGRDEYRQRLFDLAANTEINAVVVDVKNELGYTTYRSEVPQAREIGAATRPSVEDFSALLTLFRRQGLYVIARIPVFKDDLLARVRPNLAILDGRRGAPWRDVKGIAWADPTREEVWDYNIALAKEAALAGVDEIQFDYIRFPGDPTLDGAIPRSDNPRARAAAVEGFLARARAQLQPLRVKLAADLFGYTIWSNDALAVGQSFEGMTQYLDVVSPMLYPSSFTNGIPGYRPGLAYPYEIVSGSVQRALSRLAGKPIQVRPWLQDFPDYTSDRHALTVDEVAAQIRAAKDAGAAGFMLWNPYIIYTRAALASR